MSGTKTNARGVGGHTWEVHEGCDQPYCSICDGGLSVCTSCGCVEGSLATECPGVQCYAEMGELIYQGRVDFRGGGWVRRNPVTGEWEPFVPTIPATEERGR